MEKDIVQNITKSEQILKKLREMIKKKYLKTGEKFPSEMDLAKKFGTSQVTMNKITSQLVAEGILVRRHGAGTFINSNKKLYFNIIIERPFDESSKMIDFSNIQLIQGILEECNLHGTKIDFIPTYTKAGLSAIIKDIGNRNINSDGFILIDWYGFLDLIEKFEENKINYVVADYILDKQVNTVLFDRHTAIADGIGALKKSGAKYIAYLGESGDKYDAVKYHAFIDGLTMHNFEKHPDLILTGFQDAFPGNKLENNTAEKIRKSLIAAIKKTDGIFVEKRIYLPVVIDSLKSLNRNDIALFSYDQVEETLQYKGDLFYAAVNHKLLGSELVRYLYESIKGTAPKKAALKLKIEKHVSRG